VSGPAKTSKIRRREKNRIKTSRLNIALAGLLCAFTLAEVNYPHVSPQSQLAVFAMLGLVLCFLNKPLHRRFRGDRILRAADVSLALASVACCAYVFVQTEPWFERFWIGGQSLGNRAGQETGLDTVVGVVGVILVLEATRRAIGWALPILATVFLVYAFTGPFLPDWMFPHRGYGLERVVSQTFLHSQGVFGTALRVMFTYVFLFVIFGALLKESGATQYVIDFARRLFGATPGGPAKVAVLSSGMMGSLSGSAVANTATTGTFTIPMMRSSGFKPEIAAGVEAAASSGGALVPPVMGAGAYMMLEIVEPPVTYMQIVKAALLPALLYYLSLLLIVHFYSKRIGAGGSNEQVDANVWKRYDGLVFAAAFVVLIAMLLNGFTVFRAVSLALVAIIVVAAFNTRTRITPRKTLAAMSKAAMDVIPLVAAASCVGIVIGVVTLTGIGTKLPSTILDLSQGNLVAALALIMVSSIILGMGLPSAVCYLLMATLIGPVLGDLGVVPLAAHLFIFYFGMLSMVTPPVALAGYTAASIAGSGIMATSFAAFRFALVGFTLPYMFVFEPELLMMSADGDPPGWGTILRALFFAAAGLVPFAAAISGYLLAPLTPWLRGVSLVAALLLLIPGPTLALGGIDLPVFDLAGLVALVTVLAFNSKGKLK
jgi:TRAP transporter 4TM/12TM fusion protein